MSGDDINLIMGMLGVMKSENNKKLTEIKNHVEIVDYKLSEIKTIQDEQKILMTGNGSPEKSVIFRLLKAENCIDEILKTDKTAAKPLTIADAFKWVTSKRGLVTSFFISVFITGGTIAIYKVMAYLIKNNLTDFITKAVS